MSSTRTTGRKKTTTRRNNATRRPIPRPRARCSRSSRIRRRRSHKVKRKSRHYGGAFATAQSSMTTRGDGDEGKLIMSMVIFMLRPPANIHSFRAGTWLAILGIRVTHMTADPH